MMNFENRPRKPEVHIPTAEDYTDNPILFGLLNKLPSELATFHITKIETENLSDNEAQEYLEGILQKREDVSRVSEVSDKNIEKYFKGRELEIFSLLESTVFFDTENHLGNGMTAKVKAYLLETNEVEVPMAIKYVTTPNAKTLSASGEHDVILEVERIQEIEEIEKKDADVLEHIRVPHPYFHHKNKDIQCYGMELIDGVTLEQGTNNNWSDELRDDIKRSLEKIPLQKLFDEVDLFFNNMHDYCLHGDIKPANIMVRRDGTFYVIDFGQSVLSSRISDKQRDQFETIKQDEKDQTKSAIRFLYKSLF